MRNDVTIKRTSILVVLLCALFFQGCTGKSLEMSANTSSLTMDYENLYMEFDQANHSFMIGYKNNDSNIKANGKLYTYDYPQVANVYKITPWDTDKDPFNNPISEWKLVSFKTSEILIGNPKYKNAMSEYDQLSRQERLSVIYSMTRIESFDTNEMNIIKKGFPNALFSNYFIKSTFPAIKSNLYEITSFDVNLDREIVIDTVIDKTVDYYVIRRSIDGIIVGLPSSVDLYCSNYDDKTKRERLIASEEYQMFYDGVDIYEVHSNDKATEKDIVVYLKDQPLLSFEQAINKASKTISQIISDSDKEKKDTHIYAAELVYLTVQITDMSGTDFYSAEHIIRDPNNAYLYPFWVIYIYSNYMCLGEDIAEHKPLLVNAVTGEVIISN